MTADVDLDIGRKTFASGLLPELIAVLRRSRPGDLIAVVGDEKSIGPDLETWCRFTGNQLLVLGATVEDAMQLEGRSQFRKSLVEIAKSDRFYQSASARTVYTLRGSADGVRGMPQVGCAKLQGGVNS